MPRPFKMTEQDVIGVLALFAQHDVEVWVDGGWGVDALLGRQTRIHADLDIAIRHADVPTIRRILEEKGFQDVPRDDTKEWNFVLGDGEGHRVDIHSFTFDACGRCLYGCPYPVDSLTGSGLIGGYEVKCISPHWMVKFHSGYTLDADDYRDVKALCTAFGILLPSEFDRFRYAETIAQHG
jgi:lincosamide nucleotidyltransferase A/C/D/E